MISSSSTASKPTPQSALTIETLKNKKLLDWTAKQGRILTANGRANTYYTAERGFPFESDELPHHHLLSNSTHSSFSKWALTVPTFRDDRQHHHSHDQSHRNDIKHKRKSVICGAWKRPLFVGGWEHSTEDDELVYNVQTNTLFVDLRIPRYSKIDIVGYDDNDGEAAVWAKMTDEQLQLYARRHAFGGYTKMQMHKQKQLRRPPRVVCTRHHCIDWNFIGVPRPRPNKWFVEVENETDKNFDDDNMNSNVVANADSHGECPHNNLWKEWAYATDHNGQHYYWERWERLPNDCYGDGLVLALRKKETTITDGIIVVVGDHFNYIHGKALNRHLRPATKDGNSSSSFSSAIDDTNGTRTEALNFVDLVDATIQTGNRKIAENLLQSIDAGHGTVSSGWIIDSALQYWKEGTTLVSALGLVGTDSSNLNYDKMQSRPTVKIQGNDIDSCHVLLGNQVWEILECSLNSLQQLEKVLYSMNTNSRSILKKRKIESTL